MKTIPTLILIALVLGFEFFIPAFASSHLLPFVPPEANQLQQGFIRITNKGDDVATVFIGAIDDAGNSRTLGSLTTQINPNASKQFNSSDLENGNVQKGLVGALGTGVGNWRLVIESISPLDVMGYIRTPDGFLNDMHDLTPSDDDDGKLHTVYIFNPASNINQQSKLHISNSKTSSNSFIISAIDDAGNSAPEGQVSLTLAPLEAIILTSQDLELGNTEKGLTGFLGDGEGKWQLSVQSTETSAVVNYMELPGGYISNLSGAAVDIFAVDAIYDETKVYESAVERFTGPFTGPLLVSLENGQFWEVTDGLIDEPMNGVMPDVIVYYADNDWNMLVIGSNQAVKVQPTQVTAGLYQLSFVPPAANLLQQGFIRITNKGDDIATVALTAVDDAGNVNSDALTVQINPNASKQFNSSDLENGNVQKGLTGALGTGAGNWWLLAEPEQGPVSTTLDFMAYIRTPDGFLNDMHDLSFFHPGVEVLGEQHTVYIFNPASNLNQQSKLRIINWSSDNNAFVISAIDDAGNSAPGGQVSLTLSSHESISLTAQDLEFGNTQKGLTGFFGDGEGKWRLSVQSTEISSIVNYMELPGGYISNLSKATTNLGPVALESTVNGFFNGWTGDTIVGLANGQFWQQTDGLIVPMNENMPDVIVYDTGYGWKMLVLGSEQAVKVRRLQ